MLLNTGKALAAAISNSKSATNAFKLKFKKKIKFLLFNNLTEHVVRIYCTLGENRNSGFGLWRQTL
jgi:hypothetical protein